jgi:hypothetical protein
MATQILCRVDNTVNGNSLAQQYIQRDYDKTVGRRLVVEPTEFPVEIALGLDLATMVFICVLPYSASVDTSAVSFSKNGSLERVTAADILLLAGTAVYSMDVVAPDGAVLELFIGGA